MPETQVNQAQIYFKWGTVFNLNPRPITGRLEISEMTLTGEQRQAILADAIASQPEAEICTQATCSFSAAWDVSYNSIHPASPRFRLWLREHFAGTRRYL